MSEAKPRRPLGPIRVMSQVPDIQEHLDELTAIAKPCWLGVNVQRFDFNPPRNPDGKPAGRLSEDQGTPMDRFVFMGDCFTSMDGEIAADGTGFAILYNAHLVGRYIEDGAFHGPAWETGRFVPWALFKLALQYYVALANSPLRTFYNEWPPKEMYPDSAQKALAFHQMEKA